MRPEYQKKVKLAVAERQIKWAPFWAVLRRFGKGKARHVHPSQITAHRRHWRQTKLKIKPRRTSKSHLG
jgi:ribosomal protein L39E